MTGAPAEVWRKFRFATLPEEAWLSRGVFSALSERSVTVYLPLTRRSDRNLTLFTVGPVAVVVAGAMLASVGAITGLEVAVLLGLFIVAIGGISVLLSRPFVGPQGKVVQVDGATVIELSHVNAGFIAAVIAMNRDGTVG